MRILFLAHRVPFPPNKGDRIRSYHLLKHLRELGDVAVGCLSEGPASAAALAAIRELASDVHVAPLGPTRWLRAAASTVRGRSITEGAFTAPALGDAIRQWRRTREFDVAVVFCSSMRPYVEQHLVDVPVVFDCVDVDSVKWLQYAEQASPPKRWVYGLEAERIARAERALAKRASAVTLVSPAEAELFRKRHSATNVNVVTNGVDLDFFTPRHEAATRAQCVFVGALNYRPNVAGVTWFVDHVWTGVRARWPGATLKLVGLDPTAAVRGLSSRPGVKVVGAVPDVRPYVASSAAVVVPLQVARGVQNKVLEAMAMARPVVLSPAVLGGLSVTVGEHALCAATPEGWVAAITGLFEDDTMGERIGQSARLFVEQHHRWSACLKPLGALVTAAAGGQQ